MGLRHGGNLPLTESNPSWYATNPAMLDPLISIQRLTCNKNYYDRTLPKMVGTYKDKLCRLYFFCRLQDSARKTALPVKVNPEKQSCLSNFA